MRKKVGTPVSGSRELKLFEPVFQEDGPEFGHGVAEGVDSVVEGKAECPFELPGGEFVDLDCWCRRWFSYCSLFLFVPQIQYFCCKYYDKMLEK